MCILFIAVKQHSDYPLIIAANRDEFHARPTQQSHWWEQSPAILAGKDLQAGGTWMGITRTGQFAALTNIRDPERTNDQAQSRGELVVNALTTDHHQYHKTLTATKDQYNGFNLLYGTVDDLQVYNNHQNSLKRLGDGVYGLSNAALNSPWPKTTKGMRALTEYCQSDTSMDSDALFDILRNDEKASDHDLPSTGVPYEWEKALSSAFIQTPNYGTRTSTVLMVHKSGEVNWEEHTFNPQGEFIESETFTFQLQTNGMV